MCSSDLWRNSSISNFEHHWDKVEATSDDGSGGNVNMAYMDIRFSNLCNLKCRSCGPQTKKRLTRLGVKTVGDLAKLPVSTLTKSLGKAAGTQLWRLSRGIDARLVVPDQKLKSVGHEETFPQDKYEDEELNKELSRIVDAVASRLRKSEKLGRTITVKQRTPEFVTRSKSKTLPNATNTSAEILDTARDLLGEHE